MMTFKATYIEPILTGEKTSTIRARCSWRVGQVVPARCQYHLPPFAQLEVERIEQIPAAAAPAEARALYPDVDPLWRIHFRRVD